MFHFRKTEEEKTPGKKKMESKLRKCLKKRIRNRREAH